MQNLFSGIYKDKTVLYIGYSLEAPTTPNHIELLNVDMVSIIGDIN